MSFTNRGLYCLHAYFLAACVGRGLDDVRVRPYTGVFLSAQVTEFYMHTTRDDVFELRSVCEISAHYYIHSPATYFSTIGELLHVHN